MQIPSDYRRLKNSEAVRTGDLYKDKTTGAVGETKWSIGRLVKFYPSYSFWRKRVKPVSSLNDFFEIQPTKPTTTPKTKKLQVVFLYPSSKTGVLVDRQVEVISIDNKHLRGLEMRWNYEYSRWNYTFKQYLRMKMKELTILSYE